MVEVVNVVVLALSEKVEKIDVTLQVGSGCAAARQEELEHWLLWHEE